MEEEGISYEMLQDLLRAERRSNKLTPVPARFWHDVRTFLHDLEAAFRVEQAKDPFSRRTRLATDQVINSRSAVGGIWALRERKLAMMALAQEDDVKRPHGITPGEADLFDVLAHGLRAGRHSIMGNALGAHEPTGPLPPPKPAGPPVGQPDEPAPTPPTDPAAASPAPTPTPVVARPAAPVESLPPADPAPPPEQAPEPDAAASAREKPAHAPAASPRPAQPPVPGAPATPPPPSPTGTPAASATSATPATPAIEPSDQPGQPRVQVPSDRAGRQDLVVIRALGDIPPFVGPDMQTYLLKEGDIASVPASIANLLAKRSRAVVVEDE